MESAADSDGPLWAGGPVAAVYVAVTVQWAPGGLGVLPSFAIKRYKLSLGRWGGLR